MTSAPIPEPQKPASVGLLQRVFRHIPRKVWFAIVAGLLALVGLVFLTSSGSATLNVICRHSLRSAALTVFIDGKVAFTQQIAGSVKKRFGVLDKRVEGSFSKSLKVPSGEHVVQVHLSSAADGFDQTRQVGVNLLADKEATVAIGTQRNGMSVIYQGPPVSPTGDSSSSYFGTLRSIAVTVFGSAVSAAIGFMVQEFLRARKSPQP